MQDAQQLKIAAAAKALEYVSDGMRLGIGTGSTANEFIKLLAARVNDGLRICGVPTSQRSADLCRELSVPLATLEEMPELDLTIDGADEIGPNLSLIKGGGGALLREKIVAAASKQMLVIADSSKIVEKLGAFPLPIEVNQFGLAATKHAIEKAALTLGLSGAVRLRHDGNKPYITDGGHFILDASFGEIIQPKALADALVAIPGVVEHGMFLGLAGIAVIADEDGQISVLRS
ncbi:ribose-5-phosphate isomerase RpiA [Bartonella sp. HY329]|uniref:ribose-5-phosphate isomerase RpiA n=1 Tax=unclassified Bartonella TaxID=2645622 RepID=UPI0021C79615|nr:MULTISPECIES: ribose-5-phosphate isomerase RpiA [unclassified Bartonella]UXM95901.1 ribose-5-phosphate isomerase RpiA [Bartonella sp. HY329]UXN10226.1 ribose-5-phosphate isomerase RpiA [Bartonella sp. HY328]